MYSRHSPLKRKHNEYHDPDYPQQELQNEQEEEEDGDDDGKPGCSAQFSNKRKAYEETKTQQKSERENYYHKVRLIIDKEFQKEIVMKQQQLEEIDEKLEKAKNLLDRLRYGIVSAYYKKQEIPLTAADAASLRGQQNLLFDREDRGPQMPLHPSVKKLIGKRPKDLSEVIRSCPKRTAAQNAVQTIRAKSQIQKREERKLKQIIREQGIVIDHSKQIIAERDVNSLINEAAQTSLRDSQDIQAAAKSQGKSHKESSKAPSGKSLNATRLNNKIKHLIVVGNTSKYIGNEFEKDIKPQAQNLSHKWLVYVQSKDSKQPIERFIKKVRFHLHHSYRPNDVVDIEAPPFQVSRRGWGEFPIRVQLFFHLEYHQKPVQLVHNIILDQTLSGIQTLGAETLLEIWLREIKTAKPAGKKIKTEVETIKKPEIPTKLKTNLMTRSEELMDDNLLDFLNKIETSHCSISGDIEKIQPTVVVTEPLGVKLKTPSPEKCEVFQMPAQRSPIKMPPLIATASIPAKSLTLTPTIVNYTPQIPKVAEKSMAFTPSVTTTTTVYANTALTSVATSSTVSFKTTMFANGSLTSKPITTFVKLPTSSAPVKLINSTTATNLSNNIPPLRPLTPTPQPHIVNATQSTLMATNSPKTSIILNKDGKILMPSASVASAVRRTILPIVNNTLTTQTSQLQTTNKPQIIPISTSTSQVSQFSMPNKPQLVPIPTKSSASSVPKQILQKKLVQLVDSTGKVKYIQMLVAASSASSSLPNLSTSSVAPKLISMAPSTMKNNSVTNTTQITNTVTTPLLKAPNGAHLMPAMTMKPNIFKIVPESRQTKPQILTFSTTTVVTTNTNTLTTAHNLQQQLQKSNTATPRTLGHIPTPSTVTASRPHSITMPVANKLLKPNGNNTMMTPPKNLVFQKEGKVYIIDPQQMKYRQQQKKQVSLLKPQISLLKQQQQKLSTANLTASVPPAAPQIPKPPNIVASPQVHFGLKQQRINSINALQLQQMKRVLFEKQFLRQEFLNIRSAVEFLLRRLKLVVSKDSLVSAFPFVCNTLQEFHSLTAFKQRACEWLRAKNISRMIRHHKNLQRLNSTSKETFWSTKEIATFARQYAYTPPIKSLPRPGDQRTDDSKSKDFMSLVKSELKQKHNLQYDTLTDHHKVRKWVDKLWHTLEDYEHHEDQHQIIDIDGIEEDESKTNRKLPATTNASSTSRMPYSSMDIYLAAPPHLEHQCQLVSDICKDLHIKLNHEELDTKLYHPSTQTVLAQSLHLFIEKLLRQTIALKQEKTEAPPSNIDAICTIMPQDLAKVIASNNEFDFLTNINFGSASLALAENLESSIKQEKS